MGWTPFKVWLTFIEANRYLWGKIALHPHCSSIQCSGPSEGRHGQPQGLVRRVLECAYLR